MQMNNSEYLSLIKYFEKKSHTGINIINAFWTGGLICTLGQFILDICSAQEHLTHDEAVAMTTVILVLFSSLCTGAGIYQPLAKFAGAGTLVPVTGFANGVVSSGIEFRSEGLITGIGIKLFTIAGPVIVYGGCAAFIYGVILWAVHSFM